MTDQFDYDPSRDVIVRRLIPAPPETVFRFWTEAEHLQKWFGPAGVTCMEAEVDLRVGGKYRIANLLPNGKIIWIQGEFEVIEPPTRLQYTWGIGLDSIPTERVTVVLRSNGGATELVLLHENAANKAIRDSHESGWVGCLDGLERYASTT